MSLREAHKRVVAADAVPNCKVAQIKAALPTEDRDYLDAMEFDRVTPTEIAKALRGDGHEVHATTVMRHYRGDCACGQATGADL